jgi:hypothetical protein
VAAVVKAYIEHRDAKVEMARCGEEVEPSVVRDFAGALRASVRVKRAWDVLEVALAALAKKDQP